MTRYLSIFLLLICPWASIQGRAGTSDSAHGIEIIGTNTVDFGRYSAREGKSAVFKIQNTGKETVKIIKVHKTCGCAKAACNKDELKPGEEASVEIAILPNSITGAYSKPTYIENSSINNKFLPVTVKGVAVPLVEIKPQDFMYAGRIETNRQWACTFEIIATEAGVQFGAPEAKCNYPVETTLKPAAGTNASNHYNFDVKLLPAAISGDFQCSIKIPVISPTNQPPMAIGVSGKIGTELTAFPGTFRMPVSNSDIIRNFNLRVLGDKSIVLDPKQVKLPEEKCVRWEVKRANDGRTLDVTAIFSPEFTREVFIQGRLELFFSVPGIASAKILCLAETPAIRQ